MARIEPGDLVVPRAAARLNSEPFTGCFDSRGSAGRIYAIRLRRQVTRFGRPCGESRAGDILSPVFFLFGGLGGQAGQRNLRNQGGVIFGTATPNFIPVVSDILATSDGASLVTSSRLTAGAW